MRKILFRGKTNSGEWVYGLLSECKRDSVTRETGFYISGRNNQPYAYKVIPESVGQFTGFISVPNRGIKDEKIFEGDLRKDSDDLVYQVLWIRGMWAIRYANWREDIYIPLKDVVSTLDTMSGNIFDNPELFK